MLPVMKPRHTNSTGNTSHLVISAALGSGRESRALGTMWRVACIHQALVWFRTWPLKGTEARMRSKADWRSVVTISSRSPRSYVSRTLPWMDGVGWAEGVMRRWEGCPEEDSADRTVSRGTVPHTVRQDPSSLPAPSPLPDPPHSVCQAGRETSRSGSRPGRPQ